MIFNIYLTNLLKALSLALELSDGGLSRHHWRTAMVADRIAGQLALPQGQRHTLLYSALLHDIGAAANWEEKNSLYRHKGVADLYAHAREGYMLLKDTPQFKATAKPVLHHHDHWDGSSPSGLGGRDIPLVSRIINLADTFEVLLADGVYILDQPDRVLAAIEKLCGSKFDPDLVAVLRDISRQESFWLDLANPHYYASFFQNIQSFGQVRLDIDDILGVADIFATIVDRTSRYTAIHSRSVCEVAAYLATVKGYSAAEIKMMRIAGLLHDLGKLTIPSAILEKPGRLTAAEITFVKQHTYYTHRILAEIDGFEIIADWAAFHHETLDGTGYPFRVAAANLRLGSRIVAVADVYAALREARPYRPGLVPAEIEKIMRDMVAARRIDGDIVATLLAGRADVEAILAPLAPTAF